MLKSSKNKGVPFPLPLPSILQRRRKSDVMEPGLFTVDDFSTMQKPKERLIYQRSNSMQAALEIPKIIVQHHDSDDDDVALQHDVTTHGSETQKTPLSRRRSSSLSRLDLDCESRDTFKTEIREDNTPVQKEASSGVTEHSGVTKSSGVTKKPLCRAVRNDSFTNLSLSFPASLTTRSTENVNSEAETVKASEAETGKADPTTPLSQTVKNDDADKGKFCVNVTDKYEQSSKLKDNSRKPNRDNSSVKNDDADEGEFSVNVTDKLEQPSKLKDNSRKPKHDNSSGNASLVATPPSSRKPSLISSTVNSPAVASPRTLRKTSAGIITGNASLLSTPPQTRKMSTPSTASTSSTSTKGSGNNSSASVVPQVCLKRRECGYEDDVALLQRHRYERSSSFTSSNSVRPSSPLLELSANELLQADDDGRSSIASSMTSYSMVSSITSLSLVSGASYVSGASRFSNDSGICDMETRKRRSVSFNGADTKVVDSFNQNPRWDGDTRSISSCNVYAVGDSDGRHRHRSSSSQRLDICYDDTDDTNLIRHHNGSYNDLGLRPRANSGDPLRSSRFLSVSCQSLNSLNSEPDTPGALFHAKFYNRIGKKVDGSDALRNLSHVFHVYQGMVLLTDLLESKITFMASNGRAVKEFLMDQGSQPWSTCVTHKGHVAVTLKRHSCVTVWSGHGSLVREFGHDMLKCPTGLACDHKGRFIVADEQTNHVAIFSETGKFLKYLGHGENHSTLAEATMTSKKEQDLVSSKSTAKAGVESSCMKSDAHSKMAGARKNATQDSTGSKACVSKPTIKNQEPHRKSYNIGAAAKFGSDEEEEGEENIPEDLKSLARDEKQSGSCDCDENAGPTRSISLKRCKGKCSKPDKDDFERMGGGSRKGDSKKRKSSESDESNKKRSTDDCGKSKDSSSKMVNKPFKFSLPRYVWVTKSGKIVVSDSGSHSIKVFSEDGEFIRSIGSHGTNDGQLKVPYGVCCDHQENVYVADHYNDRVSVFTIDGEFLQHVLTSAAGLSRPKALAIRCTAHYRKLYIAHGGLRSTEVAIYKLFNLGGRRHSVTFKCDV